MPHQRISPVAAISAFCLGLSAASLAAAPARAQDDRDEGTIVLSTKNIDLASASGRAEMMARIDRAAREVCELANGFTFEVQGVPRRRGRRRVAPDAGPGRAYRQRRPAGRGRHGAAMNRGRPSARAG